MRPADTLLLGDDGTIVISRTPPYALDISDYQSKKKLCDYQTLKQNENRNRVYSLVCQQCTESMHAQIKCHHDYLAIEVALNGIDILKVITLICFNIEDEKYVPLNVHEAKPALYALMQGRDSNQEPSSLISCK